MGWIAVDVSAHIDGGSSIRTAWVRRFERVIANDHVSSSKAFSPARRNICDQMQGGMRIVKETVSLNEATA